MASRQPNNLPLPGDSDGDGNSEGDGDSDGDADSDRDGDIDGYGDSDGDGDSGGDDGSDGDGDSDGQKALIALVTVTEALMVCLESASCVRSKGRGMIHDHIWSLMVRDHIRPYVVMDHEQTDTTLTRVY